MPFEANRFAAESPANPAPTMMTGCFFSMASPVYHRSDIGEMGFDFGGSMPFYATQFLPVMQPWLASAETDGEVGQFVHSG